MVELHRETRKHTIDQTVKRRRNVSAVVVSTSTHCAPQSYCNVHRQWRHPSLSCYSIVLFMRAYKSRLILGVYTFALHFMFTHRSHIAHRSHIEQLTMSRYNRSTEINMRLEIARQVMRQLTEACKSAESGLKLKKQSVRS